MRAPWRLRGVRQSRRRSGPCASARSCGSSRPPWNVSEPTSSRMRARGHHVVSRIRLAVQQLEAAGDLLVMCRLGRQLDLAAAAEIAGDLLFPHDRAPPYPRPRHRRGTARGPGPGRAFRPGSPKSTAVPLLTWPPLRPEAWPRPGRPRAPPRARPRWASASAADRPVKPPPITATSTCAFDRPLGPAGESGGRVVPVGTSFMRWQPSEAEAGREAADVL